jgi:hypothetical protein
MPLTAEESANLEEDLVALFQRLIAELSQNVAALDVRRAKQKHDGVVAVLTPTNRAAARIVAHAVNGMGLVDFNFGEYSPTWELPFEGYCTNASKQELLQEVGEMCRAVIAGSCEHKRGLLSIRGSIQVGSRSYRVTDWFSFHAMPGTRKYEPYR